MQNSYEIYEHLMISNFVHCGAKDGDSSKMHPHFLRAMLIQGGIHSPTEKA